MWCERHQCVLGSQRGWFQAAVRLRSSAVPFFTVGVDVIIENFFVVDVSEGDCVCA